MIDASIGSSPQWSRKQWLAVVLVSLALWMVYAYIGPGDDYKRCYTWMVMEPERLESVAVRPWTLNPPWLVPFMAPFVSLPGRPGYLAFMAATIAGIVYSTYVLGGKPIPILLSSHMMWILWWGQIEVWGVLAVVIGVECLRRSVPHRKSWLLISLALALASFKPQVSLVPVLALWWWMGRERWKPVIAMLALFILSILIWGPWPVWYWQGIFGFIGDQHHGPWNASLGLWAMPLFIPALLLPLSREKRLIALTATAFIVSPYMPYYSTILLLCFAVPWWAYVFGFLSYLPSLIGTRLAWNAVVLLPILVLIWLYTPIVREWLERRGALKSPSSSQN